MSAFRELMNRRRAIVNPAPFSARRRASVTQKFTSMSGVSLHISKFAGALRKELAPSSRVFTDIDVVTAAADALIGVHDDNLTVLACHNQVKTRSRTGQCSRRPGPVQDIAAPPSGY